MLSQKPGDDRSRIVRVLVVEDDDVLGDGLKIGLQLEGLTADIVTSCDEARAAAALHDHEVIVLDIGLPDGSGLDLLREWRLAGETVPVLLLTARNLVEDRIGGLDAGADDYLGKPFDLNELTARIRALQRRAAGHADSLLTVGAIQLDLNRRSVSLAGKPVDLSRREFAVLRLLAEHPGHILSRMQIEDRIYGWQEEVGSNAVEVHVHNLRAKLGRQAIETVRGQGYRMLPA
ncbi:MAG TPA: winged helix-turn-helix domain-containing protein [Sphingomonas sp.]